MTVSKQNGLEWHDGWLASILHLDDGTVFAAFALAVNWDQHRVRFGLCPISQEQAGYLVRHHATNGFSSEFNKTWQNALSESPLYLIDEVPIEGTVIHCVEASVTQRECIRNCRLPLVEIASSPESVLFWLLDPK
jgi:hypothetical protein